ncbi:putative CDK5 regulatory subunit-associated protein 2 [Scophthalmus maximus]|uniref:Putative CDK5 regulatory subunit-associated protein 2 n=1 Tax=Scophthalmus maximus TaxID=52904 RepID=A0A2U9CFW0_SCOMX|nr:putative CDK5 regulatory subunit-associated protein 2 [Scophthalmus maximus]
MDSVVGDDVTLPVDINGSCRLPDSIDAGNFSTESMTAPSFPDKMSPIKALTMKDYENQITALKKENFNLKLRIYFMEERMQQKCDDSTEDIFKTNIELKVELESMKREMAEKQELLVSASKALESLAGRESGEPQRLREQAQREMDALRDAFHKRIADLEQCLQTAEEEVEKMAAIAEQEKRKNIDMEKQLHALGPPSTFTPVPVPSPVHDLQQALQEKDNIIEQLKVTLKNQEALIHQEKSADQQTDAPSADCVKQLSDLIAKKDQELAALRDELHNKEDKRPPEHQTLSGKLEEKENELGSEKKNALKRDKTIQGLTQVLREKEKEIAELCHEIEDRDDALAKAREVAHKAQLQKYQGAEEHQSLLMAKQTELAQLQGEHHGKVLEAQKLQRALDRKEQELGDLQQAKDQLEVELEDLQQQKKKGDKALNDLNNQLKKLSGEIGEREIALEQQYQELLDQTNRKLQTHEVTIQRLTSTLADKEQQLQEYINMVRDFEQSRSPGGNDTVLSKLRQRLKEKEKALEQALDEKFAAIEEKDDEIHQLQLSLREKERDLDRLNNLLSHNEETINSFDSLIKEKDVELQHLANTLKNLQRAKQDVEDNLNRSLKEKDSIISQLQLSLEGKTTDMEEMAKSMLSQSETHAHDLAEQMGQRLKVTEAMLAEAVKARERLVADNESAVEGLLATISSKDQLLKESAEHYNRMLSERTQEIQELRKQLSDRQQLLATAEKQSSIKVQEDCLETANLRALIAEKDSLVTKLLQHGQERDHFLAEMRQKEEQDHVLELRQTIQIMQEKLDEREAELSRRNSEDNVENIPQSKKTVVILKKELTQKTEALNRALKRENELKISVAELQSLLSELEGRIEGQAINIESLTATLKTKDEIINVLHQRLGLRGESEGDHTQDQVIVSGIERSFPRLPQRERTMIGGDSQQESLPNLVALQQEHDTLNKALRAEQQLYSSLVRSVKEQDSAQRLHALQLELTAVQLLRQKLEESIKTNEELRDDLEREIHRAKLREGMDLIDPKELESMRHQLEDAQRWNASLQARLGAIQSRGGGVGGATDGGDTLSFIGDQTSYMSICFGEEQDDSLSQLSPQELKQKVLDLQDCVSRVQTLNNELQSRLSVLEKSEHDACNKGDKDVTSPGKQMLSGTLWGDESVDSGLCQSREHAQSGNNTLDTGKRDSREKNRDVMALKSLLTDHGATSVSHLREKLLRLKSENVELRGLLKEHKSTECKEKESTDASGNSSDGQAELRQSMEALSVKLSNEKGERNSQHVSGGETLITTEGIESPQTKGQTHTTGGKHNVAKHGQSSPSSSTVGYEQHGNSPVGLVKDSESGHTLDNTEADSALFTQLELLHQECQEKEALINKLSEQLADWEELHAQLKEKELLNHQYVEALQAAESTIAYLTACSLDSQGGFGSHTSSGAGSVSGLQRHIDSLQEALWEQNRLNAELREQLRDAAAQQSHNSAGQEGKCSRIPELQTSLQEERGRREEGEAHRTAQDCKGLPPNVQVQLETLHKALREKKKASLEQDDKGVQVDLQDLGYETSGKSENDREESSSTDLEVGVNPSCSASSLPSLLKHEQATFSSTENLDSTSSTSYPSSPALSSAKVSLKSLQVYDEYGVSEDPLQLQAQVRELKVQLENQTKLVLQMQNLLRRNSLSSDHVANTSDPSVVIKDQEGTRKLSQDRSYRTGQQREKKEGENQAMRDKTIRLNMEQERERTLNRSTTEKLPQTRSRSTSPARLDSLVQSQARELSQLRQQIKESRGLGALQRRQLEELSKAFKDLLQASEVDFYMGEVVKEQLEGSLSLLDRLEGRLDKGESHLDNEDVAALELSRRFAKELQEKNRLIQSLQNQFRGQSSSSHHSSHSDLYHSDRTSSSCHSPHSGSRAQNLLAEHLQEIRALRHRLEESIRTNDRLREQLEKRLAEVEKDPATNIFIHGNEEQGHLANEVRFLWGQNQALKEQLNLGSRDKQKENEKLRETLARRTAKLEQSRKESEALRQENRRLLEMLELSSQENSKLQESLHCSKEELQRLQCEVKLQRQQLSDSQHLLKSLRVELQVYEKIKTDAQKHNDSSETTQESASRPAGSLDLSELLSEIRHLRLQLERSIQTNTALRQRLEEQLLRGPNRSETININYLLSSPDEGGRSPGREGVDLRHSFQSYNEYTSVLHDEKRHARSEVGGGSLSSSSGDSSSSAPSRLVPGHRMWANRNGRHVLGLIEDFNALRKQISEGRKLSRGMDTQLQECLHNKVIEQQHVKSLSSSMNTMQQVLEEASRLLKLVWRVSLPAAYTAGDSSNNQQDELLKNEISRLKSRLSQQERMLSGAVKRLRTTNQLKEGMERVIVDQLSLTHGVLKKARGNLEVS